jgi:hypothetical protein
MKKSKSDSPEHPHVTSEGERGTGVATPYEPVPVAAARAIAEQYGKSIVIIFAHDPVHGMLHTTTYGIDEQNRAWAAQGGEIATKALGGVVESVTNFEDYRLDRIAELTAKLENVLAAWWGEYDNFFGGDPKRTAELAREFEAVPAVIAARAALAKARGESDAG